MSPRRAYISRDAERATRIVTSLQPFDRTGAMLSRFDRVELLHVGYLKHICGPSIHRIERGQPPASNWSRREQKRHVHREECFSEGQKTAAKRKLGEKCSGFDHIEGAARELRSEKKRAADIPILEHCLRFRPLKQLKRHMRPTSVTFGHISRSRIYNSPF
jgi:hypothetical protein